MAGFALDRARQRRAVGRNLSLDLTAAIGVGIGVTAVSTLMPVIARRSGVEPIGLAVIAAAPFVANALGAFAGRLGPRTPPHLGLIRGIGAASLVLLIASTAPPVVALVATAFWLSISFGGPFHLQLWGAMYPARLRGRIVGAIGTSRAAATAVAAIVGGVAADRIGGPATVAAIGIIAAACALAYPGLRARVVDRPPRFSPRDSFRALTERPILGRVALAQGFYGGGLVGALPLYTLVYVDRLDLSLADIGVIGLLTAASTTACFLLWGTVADRSGGVVAMRIGSGLGLVSVLAVALAPNVGLIWLAAVAAGAASASIDVGLATVVSDETPLADRAAAMAGLNALTGIRGIAAALLMGTLVEVGVVGVTGGLLLCAAVTAVGVVLYARTPSRAARRVAPSRFGARTPDAVVNNSSGTTRTGRPAGIAVDLP